MGPSAGLQIKGGKRASKLDVECLCWEDISEVRQSVGAGQVAPMLARLISEGSCSPKAIAEGLNESIVYQL